MRSFLWIAALLLAAASLLLGGVIGAPPPLRGAGAGGFDTRAALARLERILGDQRPHPVDSAEGDAVRARLIAELRALGMRPRVTDHFVCNGGAKSRGVSCARVRNVVATLGEGPGPHVLLVSHYDSTPVGPGAADDGIGVATMIETAARLRGQRLSRPVTFLFNEGEEAGLLGARAFLARDPLAPRVDAMLNFEARGVTGPALMFETSRPNAAPLAHYARAVARPAANSLATDFYRLIPNSTDVAVFEERPWAILNFAIIGNETRYHTPGDTLASLDPRSVQHMGDQALALARDIAGGKAHAAGTVAFSDLAGRIMLVLPGMLALGGLCIAALATAGVAVPRRAAPWRGIGVAFAAMLAGSAIAFLGHAAVALFRSGDFWRGHPDVSAFALYLSATVGSGLTLALLAPRVDSARLRLGFWLLFALIGIGASIALPGATIFFLLPLAPYAIGALAARRLPRAELVGAIVAALLLFVLWTPLLWLGGVLLSYGSPWLFAPVATLILLPWLIEARVLAIDPARRPAIIGALALAAAGWLAVALTPAYSADRKQQFGIEYALDAGKREAHWLVVNDGAPLPPAIAASGFEPGAEVPWSGRKRWAASAPVGLVRPATTAVFASREIALGRVVSLRIATNGAENITLRAPPGARPLAVRAGGYTRRIGDSGKPKEPWIVRCHGRACDGLQLDVLVTGPTTVWQVIGMRPGLPRQAQPIVAARPVNAMPQYSPDSMLTVTRIRL